LNKFIETKNLLKSIKSDELSNIYNHITDKAVEWAVAGYLDYANRLLQDLWTFHIGDNGNVRRQQEGLQIMWELSGKIPTEIPFSFRNTVEIEKENRGEIRLGSGYKSGNTSELLNQIETEMQNTSGFHYGTLAARAAILALENGLIDEGKRFIRYWGIGYMKGYNYIVGYLMRNRNSSALLLQGVLSTIFELTTEKCSAEYAALSTSMKKRKLNGRSLIYGDQSWNYLIKNISLLSIEENPNLFSENIISAKWLGYEPSSEEKILATEDKIGMRLPVDYREFLKVSNGFPSHNYSTPTLLPVEEIDWLSVLDNDLTDFVEQILEWDKDKYTALTKKCLLISGTHEEQVLLFPTKNNDWECWSLVLGGGCGETWFPGFRYYMEYQLYFLECELFS
jgi:SMI1 / KNR4 family (SUKH-1)